MKTLLLSPLLACMAADTWQPFIIDEHVTVSLPGQPKQADTSAMNKPSINRVVTGFQLVSKEGLYSILRMTNAVPSATLTPAQRDTFYVRGLRDVLSSRRGILLTQATFTTAAGTGVEYKTRALSNATKKALTRYTRNLLVGATVYTFMFTSLDPADTTSASQSQDSRRFFDSVTVIKP